MDLIQKIKEQGNQASVLLTDLANRVVFNPPAKDLRDYFTNVKHGKIFIWDWEFFQNLQGLLQNFDLIQNIKVIDNLNQERVYYLKTTYVDSTKIRKDFNFIEVGDVSSGDDSEAAVISYNLSLTAITDTSGKIDIERTLAEGSVNGSATVVRGTSH